MRRPGEPGAAVPVISADFWYLGGTPGNPVLAKEGEDPAEHEAGGELPPQRMAKRPILVLWEQGSSALYCLMLPSKRLADRYGVENVVRVIDRFWGFAGQRVVLKGDGEPALQALLEAAAAEHSGEATVEAAPRDGHEQANGVAEQGVRLAQGRARTLLAALAHALQVEDLPHESVLVPWAVRHGAWLYSHFTVGPDGKTPHERLTGKPYRLPVAQFGEKVLYLRPEAERGGKLAQKFAVGVFVGREERTGRVLVATPHGLVRADKFLRLPEPEQFGAEIVEAIRGLPWDAEGRRAAGLDEEEEEAVRPLAAGGGDDRDPAAADPAQEPRVGRELPAGHAEGHGGVDRHPEGAAGERGGADQRHQRAPGDQTADGGFLPFQPRPLEVEPALEQDDRDTEVDDAEEPLAQGSWLDPTGAFRTEQRAAGQQQDDARKP